MPAAEAAGMLNDSKKQRDAVWIETDARQDQCPWEGSHHPIL